MYGEFKRIFEFPSFLNRNNKKKRKTLMENSNSFIMLEKKNCTDKIVSSISFFFLFSQNFFFLFSFLEKFSFLPRQTKLHLHRKSSTYLPERVTWVNLFFPKTLFSTLICLWYTRICVLVPTIRWQMRPWSTIYLPCIFLIGYSMRNFVSNYTSLNLRRPNWFHVGADDAILSFILFKYPAVYEVSEIFTGVTW